MPVHGTGIGLKTCYGIVAQCGGHIEVESQPGRGTTFSVFLPMADEPDPVGEKVQGQGTLPQGHETVLVVEDEPMVREAASRVLREGGYEVLEAANGFEALGVAWDRVDDDIHFLLTDVIMPIR